MRDAEARYTANTSRRAPGARPYGSSAPYSTGRFSLATNLYRSPR